MIRVLIAEDMHMIRGALVALLSLEADMEVVRWPAPIRLSFRSEARNPVSSPAGREQIFFDFA